MLQTSDKQPVFTVEINNSVSVPYVNDTGSSETCVSSNHLKNLPIERYTIAPRLATLATKRKPVRISEAARVDLHIRTMAGLVVLKQVEIFIIEEEMEEMLIGNRLLKKLGIDVNHQMEKLAGRTFNVAEEKAAI